MSNVLLWKYPRCCWRNKSILWNSFFFFCKIFARSHLRKFKRLFIQRQSWFFPQQNMIVDNLRHNSNLKSDFLFILMSFKSLHTTYFGKAAPHCFTNFVKLLISTGNVETAAFNKLLMSSLIVDANPLNVTTFCS